MRLVGVGSTTTSRATGEPRYARRWLSPDLPAPTIQTHAAPNTAGDERGGGWLLVEPDGEEPVVSAVDGKPLYKIPLMADLAPPAPGAPTAISTFSGCGGSSLGLRLAGWDVRAASEFVEAARETYRANFPGAAVVDLDIRKTSPEGLLEAARLRAGELDLLEGSPPCSSFSTAGKRDKGWGQVKPYSDTEQRTDDLFDEYVRLLRGLRPRAFLAENVSGLAKGRAKGMFIEICDALRASGYRVEARLLDAQWLGVPQQRQRIIFVGTREDLDLDPAGAFPLPLPYRYSVREALALPAGATLVGGAYAPHDAKGRAISPDAPAPTITAGVHGGGPHQVYVASPLPPATPEELEDVDVSRYAIGAEWDKLKPGEQSERYFNLVRPDPDAPCPTVTQTGGIRGAAAVTHPVERRKFTIAELRRLCGFPDDFKLTGTYGQQWERLGRAVPPPMYAAVGRTLRALLEGAKR